MVSTTLRRLYPRERPGTSCTGGWVSLGVDLKGIKISLPPVFSFARDFIFFFCSVSLHCASSYPLTSIHLFLSNTIQTTLTLAGFEPANPASHRAATGISNSRTLRPVRNQHTYYAVPADSAFYTVYCNFLVGDSSKPSVCFHVNLHIIKLIPRN